MKGFAEVLVVIMCLLFMIFACLAMYSYVIYTKLPFGPGSVRYQVNLADTTLGSSLVADVITQHKVGDRKLMQRAVETVVVDELDPEINESLQVLMLSMDKVLGGVYPTDYKCNLNLSSGQTTYLNLGEKEKGYIDTSIPLLYRDKVGYLTVSTGEK